MNQDTYEKLRQLRLQDMAYAYRHLDDIQGYQDLTADEVLTLLVDRQMDAMQARKLQRRLKEANLAEINATIPEIKYLTDRHLNRQQMIELGTNTYINQPRNIFLIGATGSGKTYIACALGNEAAKAGFKVKYIRLPDLLTDSKLAREEGTYKKIVKKYNSYDLMILDEWLLFPASSQDQSDILEIIEGRYRHHSTIICSQYEAAGWSERLGNGAVADAIMDRLTANAITINIMGDKSMRLRSAE